MTDVVDMADLKRRMDGAITAYQSDLASLRTGRASANVLDPVQVKAYGSYVPLNQVANVTAPEPRMVVANVWDKANVGAVERGIRDAGLGLNPVTDGQNVRVPLPELNEERRRELTKVANSYAEKARVAARGVRRDGMDQLKRAEKDGEAGKDEVRADTDKVQKLTDDTIKRIDEMLATKETEIMQV